MESFLDLWVKYALTTVYCADPDGDFVEAIGRQHSAEQAATIIRDHIGDWRGRLDNTDDAIDVAPPLKVGVPQ